MYTIKHAGSYGEYLQGLNKYKINDEVVSKRCYNKYIINILNEKFNDYWESLSHEFICHEFIYCA